MNVGLLKREKSYDILKGICIIFMVFGHAHAPFSNFVYLFHMAIFFICSGCFFKEKHYENIKNIWQFIKSKIRHLYLPYILWNGVLTLIHNFLININIYTNNQNFLNLEHGMTFGLNNYYSYADVIKKIIYTLLFCHSEQLGGATWFLRVLFWISVASCIGHWISKKLINNNIMFESIRFVIYFSALYLGYLSYQNNFNFYGIGTMLSCAILYYLGSLYYKYQDKINTNLKGLFVSAVILCIAYHYIQGSISLADNKYPNPILFLLVSAAGFIFILSISKILEKITIFNNIFSFIGQHTISILLFHFAFFKIITLIQVIIYSKPVYALAAFPTLIYTNGWWFLYSIIGIILPLITADIYSKIRLHCRKFIS